MASVSSSSCPVQSVSTLDLYNRWAKVYDTDGNILQAIDDLLFFELLERALKPIYMKGSLSVTELGCGTGRNTVKLLTLPSNAIPGIKELNALDISPSMLEIAESRCFNPEIIHGERQKLSFHIFDALKPQHLPELQDIIGKADLVVSTLVLEHLPIKIFFQTVKSFLKPGGALVFTNMHAEMGRRSQAGFLDTDEGLKVQGESYNYEVAEVIEAGRNEGFVTDGEVVERAVEEKDIKGGVVGERGKKWIGCKVWFGGVMHLKKDTI